MKKFPIVLDLETKHTFREFEKHKDLGITVVGVYDYKTGQSATYLEQELNKLFQVLENTSYIIGYNVKNFDMQVLQGHYPGDITQFLIFDLCDDVKIRLGRRLSLGDLVSATLGKKKTGHGLIAIDLYKQGEWDKLKQYCLDDVNLTRELFEFGVNNGYIHYLDEYGKKTLQVEWKKYLEDGNNNDMALTLPF